MTNNRALINRMDREEILYTLNEVEYELDQSKQNKQNIKNTKKELKW